MFTPRPSKRVGKFSAQGMLSKDLLSGLNIPREVRDNLVATGNHGISRETWSNDRTAHKMLLKCGKDRKRKMSLPLSTEDVLVFMEWLRSVRGVKHATITNYLAGVRQLHIAKGMEPPVLRSQLVNLILSGVKNMDKLKEEGAGKERLPMTMSMMKLLKAALRKADMEPQQKLLMWAVSCLAFNGVFRIHELLCKQEGYFDPRFTLLVEDLEIKETSEGEAVIVKVKWPKEVKNGRNIILEVFKTDGVTCPVKALKKWWAVGPPRDEGAPAFRQEDGRPLTGRKLNLLLKKVLGPYIEYKEGRVLTHSFRAGVPSILASQGREEKEIRDAGRWSSRAYELYIKLERTQRRPVALYISKLK